MNQFKNVLVFDLSSYGSALSIINQFVDDTVVKVFEVSPCGQSAILILSASESLALQIIKAESEAIFKAQILSLELIENIHEDLLPTYLSQNITKVQRAMLILENPFVSSAMQIANNYLQSGRQLTDFRVIRTYPKNVILFFTSEKVDNFSDTDLIGFNKTVIDNVQPALKSFFEI